MAIFEKDKASRRYYSRTIGVWPTSPGGVPIGSTVHYLDDGKRFIYDGQEWLSWSEEAEIIEALSDVEQAVSELLPYIQAINGHLQNGSGVTNKEAIELAIG